MKNNLIKKLSAILLCLPLIFNTNTVSFAAEESTFSIEDTTAKFNFTFSNEGLEQNDIVNAKVTVRFDTDNSADEGTTKIISFSAYINDCLTDLTCNSSDFVPPTEYFPSTELDVYSTKIVLSWYDTSDIEVPVNTDLDLGTIVFKLKTNKSAGDQITLKVDSNTDNTFFCDSADAVASLPAQGTDFEFSYTLQEASEPEAPEPETPACSHTSSNYTSNNDATCANDGTKTGTCDLCGEEFTVDDVGSAGHSFTYYVSNNDATCTEDGTKTAKCNFCDAEDTVVDEGSATGHDYGTQVVAATSTTLGGTRHRCFNCGDEFWTDFTKNDKYAQVNMPNGETVYHYCTHNGLATETTVDLGDGTKLRVFLQDPLRVLKKNDDDVLDVIVTYIPEGSSRYKELMAKNDADHAHEHIKLFEVYPTVNGRPVTGALDGSVYMEYEIPEGWDESDLEMILVRDGEDQEFEEAVLEIDGKRYLAMWKNHFSPYAMIDKLSDEEKALLNSLPEDKKQELLEAVEQLEKAVEAESNESAEKNEEKSSSNVKTGDNSGSIAVLALSTLITTGLYLELFMKKKRNV